MRYAVDNGVSLYSLLGPTYSRGNSRSPYNRARILELVNEGHSTMVKLKEHLGLDISCIREHLIVLKGLGIVEYESVNTEQEWYKQGFVSTRFASCSKSEVNLSVNAELLGNYVANVRGATMGGSELRDMEDMHKEFEGDSRLFRRYLDGGIELYRGVSPNMNALKPEERKAQLVDFVRRFHDEDDQGLGPRPIEIARGLGWQPETVCTYLDSIVEEGRVSRKVVSGRAVRYAIA